MLPRLALVAAVLLIAWLIGRWVTRRDGHVLAADEQLSATAFSSLGLPVVDVPHRGVLFGSPTCGPCDAVKRVLLQVEAERGDFTWRYVDTADHMDVAEQLKIRRVPTLVVMDGKGVVRARTSGVPSPSDLHAVLDGRPKVLAG